MKKSKSFMKHQFIAALGILFFFQLHSLFSTPTTDTYTPSAYVTISGSDNGQPVENIQVLNEAGMTNDSNTYIQLQAQAAGVPYAGYRSYFIPTMISPNTVTTIQVLANYRGPSQTNQIWTWQIYDWTYNGWVTIGNNAMAFNWGTWSVLNFNVGGPCANYIHPSTGELRIGVISNNIADNMHLGYEAVVVTSDPTSPSPGNTYFVSTSGLNSNPGTLAAPWRTISHAAKVVPAGSTVYVRGGVYSERVVFNVSGSTSAGPVTFMSYPGEKAIIDGTNITLPASPDVAPSGLLQITNVNYLTIQGFEIRNVISKRSSLFPAGISIAGTCDHIEIRHNHIHHISNGIYGAHGIGVYGTNIPIGITHLVIDGNELNALTLGSSESLVINGNVQYWTVAHNIIHDNNNIGIDAIGFEETAPNPAYDQARNGSIIGNLIYNINGNKNPAYPPNDNSADGIYIDGGKDILVDGNIVHHNNIGIELASEHAGYTTSGVIVRNNLIYLNTGPGISIGGYSSRVGSTDQCTIVNNTLFKNDSLRTGSGEFQIQYFPMTGISNNLFANNILFTNNQNLFISNPFSNPILTLNYNLYYTPSTINSPTWQWKNRYYTSYNSYKLKSGHDANSLYTNPKFVNTSIPILYLLPTSAAINAGLNLGPNSVGLLDIRGYPRVQGSNIDIGAYEQ